MSKKLMGNVASNVASTSANSSVEPANEPASAPANEPVIVLTAEMVQELITGKVTLEGLETLKSVVAAKTKALKNAEQEEKKRREAAEAENAYKNALIENKRLTNEMMVIFGNELLTKHFDNSLKAIEHLRAFIDRLKVDAKMPKEGKSSTTGDGATSHVANDGIIKALVEAIDESGPEGISTVDLVKLIKPKYPYRSEANIKARIGWVAKYDRNGYLIKKHANGNLYNAAE